MVRSPWGRVNRGRDGKLLEIANDVPLISTFDHKDLLSMDRVLPFLNESTGPHYFELCNRLSWRHWKNNRMFIGHKVSISGDKHSSPYHFSNSKAELCADG